MEPLIHLGFAILLLLITLGLALSFLAGPIALLRKTGALKAGRWMLRTLFQAIAVLFRLVFRGRRRRVHRQPGRLSRNSMR